MRSGFRNPSASPSHANREQLAGASAWLVTLIPVLLGGGILLTLVIRSLPLLERSSLAGMLLGQEWAPSRGVFGFRPFIAGTAWVTTLAVLLAVPPCLLTALYLSEYAHRSLRLLVKPLLDLLAAIPSVVYGVWGMLVIVPWVADHLLPLVNTFAGHIPLLSTSNPTGFGILSGALVLAVMIAPFIIAVSCEVLDGVPRGVRQAGLALGATRWQVVKSGILPMALPGLFAGVVLGASRALGETMAVLMVVGNLARLPHSILDPAYPLTALIANNFGEMMSIPLYDSALMAAALLLLVIVLAFNMASTLILRRLMGRVHRSW